MRTSLPGAGDVATVMARSFADDGTIGATLDLGGPRYWTYREITAEVLTALGKKRAGIIDLAPGVALTIAMLDHCRQRRIVRRAIGQQDKRQPRLLVIGVVGQRRPIDRLGFVGPVELRQRVRPDAQDAARGRKLVDMGQRIVRPVEAD